MAGGDRPGSRPADREPGPPPAGSRAARWRGLLSLAGRRVVARATRTEPRQVALNVTGVALPVALMLIVTGVSLGLAAGTTVASPGVDYWIVPEAGSAGSAVVSVDAPQLGRVHPTAARLTAREDVTYATPVLVELVRARVDDGPSEFVLAVGVVPRGEPDTFAGVSTAGLSPGDPHYGDGGYDGPWTGEAVLSDAAAELLAASPGGSLRLAGATGGAANRTFAVRNVTRGEVAGVGRLPVALVHLSELQAITGAAAGDQADQLLVMTDAPGARGALADVYPRSLVLTRSGLVAREALDSELSAAISLTALVVAVVIGTLFAASTMGLAIAADGRNRAVLAALGMSRRSRAVLVSAQAIAVTLLGGALGVALAAGGIILANEATARAVIDVPVARFHPAFVGYGLGVALLIGLLTLPYLLVMSRRTTAVEGLAD